VPVLSREARVSRAFAARTGRHVFWLEQMTFAVSVQPLLLRLQPHVVLLSEWHLAGALVAARRALRQSFRVVLCNGAQGLPPFPRGVDHVQHPVPRLYDAAIDAGEPAARHTLLPLGVSIPARFDPPSEAERAALRRRLGLPTDRPVLLSVGALNMSEKRMDYVVREVATLGGDRPFVALLGAEDRETPLVLDAARDALGPEGFTARTAAPSEVDSFYLAADAFVLASMSEGLPLAMVEALAHGLPVLAHDFDVTRFVLEGHGYVADFGQPGALAEMLRRLGPDDGAETHGHERHRSAYNRFSWDVLAPRYVELLRGS
jgi:glycosyltransferase involved in cell wall biosynthesis